MSVLEWRLEIILSMPSSVLCLVFEFLQDIREYLHLCTLSRCWSSKFNRSDRELWCQIGHFLNLNMDGRLLPTRLGGNFKRVLLSSYYSKQKMTKEKHDALLLQAKGMFEKSKFDCSQRLDQLISKQFPSLREFNVNWQSVILEGNTLLTIAARGTERVKCMELLMKKYGANIELGDMGGFNPLITAAYHNNLACVKLCLKAGANIFARGKERSGASLTAEHWAIIKNGPHAVFQHLKKYRKNIPKIFCLSAKSFSSTRVIALQEVDLLNQGSNSVTGRNSDDDQSEGVWCVCGFGFTTDMIACDCETCSIEWYHFECVGIQNAPPGIWHCPACSEQPYKEPIRSPRSMFIAPPP